MRVQTGIDRLFANPSTLGGLRGKRLGLIGNATTVDAKLRHGVDLFHEEFDLRLLYGPEHGLRGAAQDMISVGAATDAKTGLPIHSLYGSDVESLTPSLESLAEIDVLVFDIQDVGARYYTYVWTMVLAMRACAKAGVRVLVLDRPNPIGGVLWEGGKIHDGFDSFVGLKSLPNRHGWTPGEIARWAHDDEDMNLELDVIELDGWRRDMHFGDTGLPWVLPSPNMPTVDTALVYPGMCLIEGTELSEARGATRPFEFVGAPYIDSEELVQCLDSLTLPGVFFRPLTFMPTFHKFAHQECGGLQQHVLNRESYRPYRTAVAILWAIHKLYPKDFAWREKAYEFVEDVPAIDLLAGSAELRKGIEAGADFEELVSGFVEEEAQFAETRSPWLLYS